MPTAPIYGAGRRPLGSAQYGLVPEPTPAAAPGAAPLATRQMGAPGWGLLQGGGIGGYDPTNPFGSYAGARGSGFGSLGKRLIGQAGQAGLFDPMGSAGIREARRRRALRLADAQRRRGSVLSLVAGLDPWAARYAAIEADRAATGDLGNALSEADYNELTSNRDRYWNLLGGQISNEQQIAAERRARDSQGGIGGFLGQIAGTLAGGVAGGIGQRIAGGGRRAPARYEQPDRYSY